jgi:hypothetical protein
MIIYVIIYIYVTLYKPKMARSNPVYPEQVPTCFPHETRHGLAAGQSELGFLSIIWVNWMNRFYPHAVC